MPRASSCAMSSAWITASPASRWTPSSWSRSRPSRPIDPQPVPDLILRRHEDRRLRGGHAWVFANEVDTGATPLSGIEPGAAVRVLDHHRRFIGHALANPHALICARLLSRNESEVIGPDLFAARLRQALGLRERYTGGMHYRLVYGESDGLPGLVVDRFGDVLVGQIATLAMEQRRGEIETALRELLRPRMLVWKNDGGARDL